jgi:hypothetical protein
MNDNYGAEMNDMLCRLCGLILGYNSWEASSLLDPTWPDRASGKGFKERNIKCQIEEFAVMIAVMVAAELLECAWYVSVTEKIAVNAGIISV